MVYMWVKHQVASLAMAIRLTKNRGTFFATVFAVLALVYLPASAGVIEVQLGDQDFTDGTFTSSGAFFGASAGDPAPFNTACGADGTLDCSATWTFNFDVKDYVDASITLGLFDHDSAASGNQIATFTIDGVDLTVELNALLNASGGTQVEYNIYTLDLTPAAIAQLGDGEAVINFVSQGPALCGGAGTAVDCSLTTGNFIGIDFARLTLVPEPSTLALFGIGLAGLGFMTRRRRNRRRQN